MLGGLLCLAVPAGAAAAADTSTKNPASTSAAHPVSVKHSKHKSSKHSSSGKHARGKTQGKRKRGQAAIDSARAQQIQEALIRQHYLNGEPSGTWDTATQDAMRRYQADQGWQSKMVPDSRALIKLGLGPSKDGLLNPESAMTDGALASGARAETKQSANPSASPARYDSPPQ
jgi:peptidoglycan hydrolase-like protein with peptidoglycan-binding domain